MQSNELLPTDTFAAADVALWDTAVLLAIKEVSETYGVSHGPWCLHPAL